LSARRHVYLDTAEERALERVQDRNGASASAVLRYALRALVGLPLPRGWLELDELDDERELERARRA
jgi:hypothetical protein